MKKLSALLVAGTLAVTGIGSAQADWGGPQRGYYGPPPHHHHHRGGGDWLFPAAALAITGLAIGAAVSGNAYVEPAPAPVYVPPQPAPVYVAPPATSGVWYYCASSGQYYPYTRACPEGWQTVPAR